MSLKLSEGDIYAILQNVWTNPRYTRAREYAHRQGHPAACDYITIAGQALQAENVKRGGDWLDIGCNWRRANVGDQSMDGLSVKNPADGRYYFEDVIASAGTADAFIKYRHPFSDEQLLRAVAGGPYAPQGYADPRTLKTHFTYDATGPIDPPPPTGPICPDPNAHKPKPKPAYPGDGVFVKIGELLEADAREAGQTLNPASGIWWGRTVWDHVNEGLTLEQSIEKHRKEWRHALGLE